MNQNEYLNQVEIALDNIDSATREEILDDFKRHFDIGLKQGKSEEEISTSLGDVSQFDDLEDLPKVKIEIKPEHIITPVTGDVQGTITIDSGFADVTITPSLDAQHHVYLIKDGVLNLDEIEHLMIDTVSGDYQIRLKTQVSGVKLDFSGISGECDYNILDHKGRVEGRQGKEMFGDGKVMNDLRCVSGDFSIED